MDVSNALINVVSDRSDIIIAVQGTPCPLDCQKWEVFSSSCSRTHNICNSGQINNYNFSYGAHLNLVI